MYHEAQEALKPLLNGVITQEDLDDLKEELSELRYVFFLLNSLSCSHNTPGGQGLRSNQADISLTHQVFDRKDDLAQHGSQALSRADLGEEDLRGPWLQ